MPFQWDGVLMFDEFGQSQTFGPDKYGAYFYICRRFIMTFEPRECCTCETDHRTCKRHKIYDHIFWLNDIDGAPITAPIHDEFLIRATVRQRIACDVPSIVFGLLAGPLQSWE